MAELIFEPYSAIQSWYFPKAGDNWKDILSDYMQTVAKCCSSVEGSIIGHIKALVVFEEQNYFRISVIAPNIPVSIEGEIPHGCADFNLTLNILVYGIKQTKIKEIANEVSQEIVFRWEGSIKSEELNQEGQYHGHL